MRAIEQNGVVVTPAHATITQGHTAVFAVEVNTTGIDPSIPLTVSVRLVGDQFSGEAREQQITGPPLRFTISGTATTAGKQTVLPVVRISWPGSTSAGQEAHPSAVADLTVDPAPWLTLETALKIFGAAAVVVGGLWKFWSSRKRKAAPEGAH